jgi:membrane protein implicated in regulation of membrane protease activity
VVCFGCALWAARASLIPGLRVYDGFLMVIGATLLVVLVAPVVWRWSRERSLLAIAAAATLGCVAPLVFSALHYGVPVLVRLRGAWWLGGADIVGPPLIIGFVCLWFAVRGPGKVDQPVAGTSSQ